MNPRPALIAVVLAAALFGTTGTAAALGPDAVSPLTAGAWRAFIGGIGLVAVALVRRQNLRIQGHEWKWLAVGGAAVAVNQLAFLEAVDRTGVAVGTLVTIGTGPVVAGLADYFAHGDRPTRNWVFGSLLAFVGVALLSRSGTEVDGIGLVLSVLSGSAFPIFGLAAQQLMRHRSSMASMAMVFGAGAIVVAPVALAGAAEVVAAPENLMLVMYLGVATLTLAYFLWGIGLSRLRLNVVVSTTLLEPAIAALLAVGFLDEKLTVFLVLGLVLVAAGVWLATGKL